MPKPKTKRLPQVPAPMVAEAAPVDCRRALVQAVTVMALALVVRGLHFAAMGQTLLFEALVCDSGQYDVWAQRVAGGDWLGDTVFYQTPLYPYFLAVIYSIFGHSVWAVRVFQAIFGGLACVFLARAGSRFFDERAGWVAGILLALYPPAIFFDGILQKASIDLVLMAGLLWIVAEAQCRPRWRLFVLAGLTLGAMTLNRENAAVLFPVLATWIAWLSRPAPAANKKARVASRSLDWKAAAARFAVLAAGAALVLLPVGLRNYYVGGTFALTTSQMGTNFYIGNRLTANGGYDTLRPDRGDPRYEAEDARVMAEAASGRTLAPGEVSRYWMSKSWQEIQSDPGRWLKLLWWKWFLTWHAVEMVDAESIHTHGLHSPLLRGLSWVWHFGVLVPLAVLGVWLTRADWRRLWVLYAMLAAFAAAVTIFYVFARYRYPLVPVAVLFAGAGVAGAWDRLRRTPPAVGEVAIGFLLAVLAAIFCNWPFAQIYNEDGITYYNAGSTLLDHDRIDDAIALLSRAAELEPGFGATFNNLGRAAQRQGDQERALAYFDHAVKLEPDHAIYHLNRATVLISKKDREAEAIAALRSAVELDPLLVPALRPLARIERQQGNLAAAVDLLSRIVRLENSVAARVELAAALEAQGNYRGAIAELRAALQLERAAAIGNQLAWLLATAPDDTARQGAEAVTLAESLCQATGNRVPELLGTLAAAYAEVGQFEQAVQTVDAALSAGAKDELAAALARQRAAYEASKPWRSKPSAQP